MEFQEWGTPAWAKTFAQTQAATSRAINQTLNSDDVRHLDIVKAAYTVAFAKDSPMKIQRFASLRTAVLDRVLPQLVHKSFAAAGPVIQHMKQKAWVEMYQDDARQTFIKLSKGIQGCLTERIFNALQEQLPVPSQFALEEERTVAAQRASLHQQLHMLEETRRIISNIPSCLH